MSNLDLKWKLEVTTWDPDELFGRLGDMKDAGFGVEWGDLEDAQAERVVHVLVESQGLIPSPMLFESVGDLRAYVVARLIEDGPEGYVGPTVEGAGDPDALADELYGLDAEAQALRLVDYLDEGGCVFNGDGDEFRWFTETIEAEGGEA